MSQPPDGDAAGGQGVRQRLTVTGTVQGVGFRPHVHRLASALGLSGVVGNDAGGVFIEVEGPRAVLSAFGRRLVDKAPPLSQIDDVTIEELPRSGHIGFTIVASTAGLGGPVTSAPPDTATCAECLAEMNDPTDRRFRHAFITCTNCGPRFTIITRLPYDRPATTMAEFAMCDPCRSEYEDPTDRRYHAQPVSCHDCGPTLTFTPTPSPLLRSANSVSTGRLIPRSELGSGERRTESDRAIAQGQRMLVDGGIVAVKGVGGYHLACRADDPDVVAQLRQRKHRPGKPFALLVPDVATARLLAHVGDAEAALLESPAAPIVLLRARTDGEANGRVAPEVAPGNPLLGIMVASNPLHHLLLAGPLRVLVLTSGNISHEPLCTDDDEARERLAGIANGFLTHDRRIDVPCDDSVVRMLDGAPSMVRRSRGYVPTPIPLPITGPPVLALGAELKTTICLTDGHRAILSQHLGDMGSLATYRAFEQSIHRTRAMHAVEPTAMACDAHPDHTAHRWALRHGPPTGEGPMTVQHHHAHVAAAMAEHSLDQPVIGVAFDGTGYGQDGTIWGGEILRADYRGFVRVAHLSPVLLPGGDAAIRHPRRIALSHLLAAGVPWADDLPPVAATPDEERQVLATQLDRQINSVPTTSMGRLFDAVSSLLGIRHDITFEAQAAIEMEVLAEDHERGGGRPCQLTLPATQPEQGGPTVMDCRWLILDIVAELAAGTDVASIALGFHQAVAEAVVVQALAQRDEHGLDVVCLTGGVFANALLARLTTWGLRTHGFTALQHRKVPPNDGGIALGQAAVATARLASATVHTGSSADFLKTSSGAHPVTAATAWS